jgi:hypothetical protein
MMAPVLGAHVVFAQQPAAAQAPAASTEQSIRLGLTLYTDYTYTKSPEVTDQDGNLIHPSQFNVSRSYINITGNVARQVSFRLTPDIARETGAGSSLNGGLVFRIKYAFGQVNLDDWVSTGSWVRLGIQQTPWVDFQENVYRYRFQGTVFSEREGFLSSSDGGASFRYNMPSNYGEIHVGMYNGENYNRIEANDQKALELRATVRPFAQGAPVLRGIRAHLFYDHDAYVKDAERRRTIGSVTFEHKYLNAGYEYLTARDRLSSASRAADGRGYSVWATPRTGTGWEALLRYDHLTPDHGRDTRTRNRAILGVAYWFPSDSGITSAVLLDYDRATFDDFEPIPPKQERIAVHALVNF